MGQVLEIQKEMKGEALPTLVIVAVGRISSLLVRRSLHHVPTPRCALNPAPLSLFSPKFCHT